MNEPKLHLLLRFYARIKHEEVQIFSFHVLKSDSRTKDHLSLRHCASTIILSNPYDLKHHRSSIAEYNLCFSFCLYKSINRGRWICWFFSSFLKFVWWPLLIQIGHCRVQTWTISASPCFDTTCWAQCGSKNVMRSTMKQSHMITQAQESYTRDFTWFGELRTSTDQKISLFHSSMVTCRVTRLQLCITHFFLALRNFWYNYRNTLDQN